MAPVEERAAGRAVTAVRVRVGALHAVTAEAFDQTFIVAAHGTVAEGTDVDLVVTPALITWSACGAMTQTTEPYPFCPECGSASGGDEFVLESIWINEEIADVPRDPQ